MDNGGALDFSLKKSTKKVQKLQNSFSSSDEENPLSLVSEAGLMSSLNSIQFPLGESPLMAAATSPVINSPASIVSSICSAAILNSPSTKCSSAAILVDPSLMSTTSLALSTLYRRRRRQCSTEEKHLSSGAFSPKSASSAGLEKDDAYWERRRKNNQAAKRSRDARKMKEDEIAMRAAFLEQENCKLKAEVAVLKNEMVRLHCLLFNQMQA